MRSPALLIVALAVGSSMALATTPWELHLQSEPKSRPAGTRALERDFHAKCSDGKVPPAIIEPDPQITPARQDASRPFTQPAYPPGARVRNEEGTVVMMMLVTESGRVAHAVVELSTGSKDLDAAALNAAGDWYIIPASRDGQPVCRWARFAMTFRLEGAPPDLSSVTLLPSAERAYELLSDDMVLRWVVDLSGRSGARGGLADLADEVLRARPKDAALIKHDGEAILSLAFTEDELKEVVKILESPTGMKLYHLQPILLNQYFLTFNPEVRRTGCSVMLLKQSLEDGVTRQRLGGSGLPPAFRDAVPRLVGEGEKFCDCATEDSSWSTSFRLGGDPLAAVEKTCGKPPELKW